MTMLLIGCGYWGQNWAKTLARLNCLSAICDPAIETLNLCDRYPQVALYDTVEQALLHPGIEGVIIAAPAPLHSTIATQCLLSGKHVLVEKPMTLTTQESEELVRLASEKNRVLAVGHLLMYHPALLKLQAMIRAGELGDVLAVQCTRANLGKIRNEENCWWSFAPHDVSILTMLLEEPIEVVSAIKLNPLGRPEIEDEVVASFRTSSGRAASIRVSWLSPMKTHQTVVIGTQKMAIFEDTQPPDKKLVLLDYQIDRLGDHVQSVQKGHLSYVPYDTQDELLAMEAQAFIEAIRSGASLQNDGYNGLQAIRILEEVQELLHRQSFCVTA